MNKGRAALWTASTSRRSPKAVRSLLNEKVDVSTDQLDEGSAVVDQETLDVTIKIT